MWNEGRIGESELQARVVLIHKQGDADKFDNYMIISLLNTLYEVFAPLLHIRVSETLDRHLQQNNVGLGEREYGRGKHLTRRIIKYGESKKTATVSISRPVNSFR